MKIVVGLGNPGKEYEKTRHNAGFMVIDAVAKHFGVAITTKKFNALIGECFVKGEKIVFVKPQTYMNLSGTSVQKVLAFYNRSEEDIVVISDDLDLEIGKIRLREKGSSGGQKGIQSIIDHLGTNAFLRIKVGIGNNRLIDTKDYVLGKMDSETALAEATSCVIDYCQGMTTLDLMNRYN